MNREQEKIMYVHALMKWSYLQKHSLASSKEQIRIMPVLSNYHAQCSICANYVCTTCVLTKYGECCDINGSISQQYSCAKEAFNIVEANTQARRMYDKIAEIAKDKGYFI